MRCLVCNSHSPSKLPPPPPPTKPKPKHSLSIPTTKPKPNNNWAHKPILSLISGALSLNLLLPLPLPLPLPLTPSFADAVSSPPYTTIPEEYCREQQEDGEEEDGGAQMGTNEGIVEEAWRIVNDSFMDTGGGGGRRRWSADTWQRKKEDILATSIQTRSKAHDLIKRMLASLGDPYTRFLSPSEFLKMARYDMTGIGINLREVPDENGRVKLKVLGLLLDGPAHAAGVKQGDEILAVNGEEVKGKLAFDVSSMLQGPNETFVTIKVKRGNCGPIESLEVQRQVTARSPVFYRLEQIDNGSTLVGYVRLKEFNALARKDLVIAMKRLQDMGASYFILDLRDNLGGLVQVGIEIAKLFLNEGETVIYTVGRDSQYQNTIVADAAPLVSAPVIVLVNNRTASASEIVASALHDNCRAVLVGERTFGKGLIQSVFELHDGSGVVVTVGKYVTPNHIDINGNGLKPDYRSLPAWNEVTQHLSQCHMHQQG